jgi:carbamoyltransferase
VSVILGLNVFDADASACLVRNGAIVSAVAEERLGVRRKHFAGFPTEAIKFVLHDASLTIADVDHVAIGHDKRANRAQKARDALTRPLSTARAAALSYHASGDFVSTMFAHRMGPFLIAK